MNKKTLALLGIALALTVLADTAFAHSLYTQERNVSSVGTIASSNIGVYSEPTCSSTLTSLDWGLLYPGLNKTRSIYVRNEGTVDIVLFINATDWTPTTVLNYISLNFDYKTQMIKPEQTMKIDLTMRMFASANELKSFNFNIKIASTECTR